MQNQLSNSPNGWLAFELNVLRRLKYQTAILPFTHEPNFGAYLKRWNVACFCKRSDSIGLDKIRRRYRK